MSEEKKYEVLPGVDIPDMKTIKEAASDYSASGVEDFEIKTFTISKPVGAGVTESISADELASLQNMGDKVAADEERQAAESRKRMDAIMKNAVQAPKSFNQLRRENAVKMNEEERKKIEAQIEEEEKAQAEIDAKNKAREDRRKLQQQLLEEARERARIDREQEKYLAEKKKEEEKAASEANGQSEGEVKAETDSIATDAETFDDFSEFLGEENNKKPEADNSEEE